MRLRDNSQKNVQDVRVNYADEKEGCADGNLNLVRGKVWKGEEFVSVSLRERERGME